MIQCKMGTLVSSGLIAEGVAYGHISFALIAGFGISSLSLAF